MRFSFPVRTPAFIQKILPGLHFSVPGKDKVLYLTFDDGPLPHLCPWILECLMQYDAKACFFLVGENAAANPDLVNRILEEGHSIGNHTQNHLNGFKTLSSNYLSNVKACQEILQPNLKTDEAPMFRPPYGKIRPAQIRNLRSEGYEIVMWDVLSRDYDASQTAEQLYQNVVENVKPGSILVFHDNIKAERNLRIALPRILKNLGDQGYRFEAIRFPFEMD
jgi:peptidoglycan/xylan/chitin deacetylase (PgdA/CDA1 family)